jgi:23S rRNA (uracil1939-C5)-methyltransferase
MADFKENQIITMEITGLNSRGQGVGRMDGFVFFITGALPGETVQARVREVKKNYGTADSLSLVKTSPDRVTPVCPVFGQCGGCQLQHLSYQAQIRCKQQAVAESLRRIGGLQEVSVDACSPSPCQWNYRNKLQLPAGFSGGRPAVGFYAEGSHHLIRIESCPVQLESGSRLAATFNTLIREVPGLVYDERTGQGILRHILIRSSEMGGCLVGLVTKEWEFPGREKWISRIREKHLEVKGIIQNFNPERGNVILGKEEKVWFGNPLIEYKIGEVMYKTGLSHFFQINTSQIMPIFNTIRDFLAPLLGKKIIDAYCGTGLWSLMLAREGASVWGFDRHQPSIDLGELMSRENKIAGTVFARLSDTALPKNPPAGFSPPDAILLDPPREGCSPEMIRWLKKRNPGKIAYVSCNPQTFSRDAGLLTSQGYTLSRVHPFDMFPQTAHVELAGLFLKKSSG